MHVQVVLREDVPNLGRTGDVVRVRAGYARNFLLPRNLAVEANARNLREFEHQKRLAMLRRERQKNAALTLKQQLEALAISIGAHAGEEGKLFGSVTNIDLEKKLREHGFELDRRKIALAEPIKQLGEYAIAIKLDSEVDATIKVAVVAE